MNKRISAFLLAALMIMALVPAAIFAEDADLEIGTLHQLKAFRDAVNSGENYDGKTIILTDDIDLANEEWTPIGTSTNTFNGMFDGQGHTISNLKISMSKTYVSGGANENYAGLFGYMKGGNDSGIKNLTINNASVTGCLYVGVVLGRSYTGGIIENCHVTGTVKVDGYSYIGGIVGRHDYSKGNNADGDPMAIYNCSVEPTGTATINGDYAVTYVGGIVGFMGEGDYVISECTVKNVKVTGVYGLGGISGIGHYGNTISFSTVEESTIISNDNDKENERTNNVGLLVGANQGTEGEPTMFEGNTLKNVLGSVSYTDNTKTEFTDRISGSNINGGEPVTEGEDSTVVDYTPPPAYAGPVMNWVKINSGDNGVVKSGPLAASAGATITLYPKAAVGFVLDTVEVLDAEGNAIELNGLKFQIPAGGVTVNATFKAAQ